MKAIKIDIKKEVVYMRDLRPYKVATIPELGMATVGSNCKTVIFTEHTYFPRKVFNKYKDDFEVYLVKEDENKMFMDLLEVQNDYIKELISKEQEKAYYDGIREGKNRIRSLPWYKRLFNK